MEASVTVSHRQPLLRSGYIQPTRPYPAHFGASMISILRSDAAAEAVS